jgi:streptogramin lyase
MRSKGYFAVTTLLALWILSFAIGCGSNLESMPSEPVATAIGDLHGNVHGGRQPVEAAHLYLFAAGAGVIGTASRSLLIPPGSGNFPTFEDANGNYYIKTDANGDFNLSGAYTCMSGEQVYMYAVGGQPVPNVTNLAAGNMAVLGNCPSSGSFADVISFVYLNEVSTVATAYAVAGFATDATHVSASDNALAKQGLKNAFANAGNLYNIQVNPNSQPSAALELTPYGNGLVPYKEINSLGNSLAACVNSTGSSSSECTNLFSSAKSAGTTGTTATDTATFAIYLAQHPRPSNSAVKTIYQQAARVGTPYQPTLTAVPSDWTVSIMFTGGGVGRTGGQSPHDVAVDAGGNIYTTNYFGNTWAKFSPLGVPASGSGFGAGLNGPGSVAIDSTSSHVWLVNYQNSQISRFATDGSGEVEFNANKQNLQDAQLDGSGNVWITANGGDALVKMSSGGTVMGSNSSGLSSPFGLAIQAGTAGDIWIADETQIETSRYKNSGTPYALSPYIVGGVNNPTGVAIDVQANIWLSNGDGSVSKLTTVGPVVTGNNYATGSGNYSDGIAIDGDGNAWITNSASGTVYELNNSGTNLSTTTGYISVPTAEPDGIAIDGSGNVWYDSYDSDVLYELVGAAAPVVTPLAYGVANNELGTRP